MGEVALSTNGLMSKVSILFNNSLYSDVELHFLNGEGELTLKIYAHKLILALQSKAFAYMFFEKRDKRKVIDLPASKQASFYHLIKFIYTDNVQLQTYEETQDLLELAKAYAVDELSQKCSEYLMKDQLTFANIFSRYDYALKKNVKILLDGCRHFVCSNMEQIIKSNIILGASLGVVEDILKQENLSVPTELDIIVAAINWASVDLKKSNIPSEEKHLRGKLHPILKYLRVLTLSSSEFEYIVENHDIFSSYETMVITRKILQPECNVKLPEGICCITQKRNFPVFDNRTSHKDIFELPSSLSDETKKISFETEIFDVSRQDKTPAVFGEASAVARDRKSEILFHGNEISDKPVKVNTQPPVKDETDNSPKVERSKTYFENKKISSKGTRFSSSQLKSTKFSSTPNMSKVIFPQPLQDITQGQLRNYTIPLKESENCFNLSFRYDIKSSITFRMKSGNLSFWGFELKVKSSAATPEELKFFVHLQGFSNQIFSEVFKKELHNDFITFKFPKAMLLKEGTKGELEVSVDNLHGNRCSTCNCSKQFELNNGLNFAVEINLNSNKKTDDGFLFLVSKLIYVPF